MDWLEYQGSSSGWVPRTELTHKYHHALHFMWVPGPELRPSYLQVKHFTKDTNLPKEYLPFWVCYFFIWEKYNLPMSKCVCVSVCVVLSTWHKPKTSGKRELQLRKHLHLIGLYQSEVLISGWYGESSPLWVEPLWAWGPCLYRKNGWSIHGSKPISIISGFCFSSCLQFPALSSCPDFLWWLTIRWSWRKETFASTKLVLVLGLL